MALTAHLSSRLAIEASLSPPYRLDLRGAGSVAGLGTIGHLESWGPVAILQWRFGSESQLVRPFFGAGVVYAIFLDEEASGSLENLAGGPVQLSFENAWSPVWQAGLEFQLADHWRGALTAVAVDPDTDVEFTGPGGSSETRVDIDAWTLAMSLGYRF